MNLHPTPSLGAAPAPLLPGFAADAAAAGSGFADLLVERQAARAADGARPGQRSAFDAAPAPRAEARAHAPERERTPAAPHEAQASRHDAAPREGAARSDKPAPRAERRDDARRERAAASGPADRAAAADATAESEATPVDPLQEIRAQAVIDWFARLEAGTPPVAAVPPAPGEAVAAAAAMAALPADATVAGDQAADPAAAVLSGAAPAAEARRPSATLPAGRPEDPTAATAAATAEALPPADAAKAFDAARPTAEPLPAPPLLPGAAGPLAPTQPTPGIATASATGGAAAPLLLSAPVDSPDFPQALASQLTTLARDGVHEATLQLNPAEMGPIAVKIVLDGAQAQIDFAAAHARTREAIEAGLPSLAAALHGAGLTLAGGGVYEQRPGRDGDAPSRQGGRDGAATEADDLPAAATPRRTAVRGLLDAYA